jgi:hypothetical protein
MGLVVAVASLSSLENSETECSENAGGLGAHDFRG